MNYNIKETTQFSKDLKELIRMVLMLLIKNKLFKFLSKQEHCRMNLKHIH